MVMSPNEVKILRLREIAWRGIVAQLKVGLPGEDIQTYVDTQEGIISQAFAAISWRIVEIPSSRPEGEPHNVHSDGMGYYVCTCKAAKFGKECWAIKQVQAQDAAGQVVNAIDQQPKIKKGVPHR